ncbi:hypothetical protein LINPERPRIM_LOCUS20090, partial [Linum perenne]
MLTNVTQLVVPQFGVHTVSKFTDLSRARRFKRGPIRSSDEAGIIKRSMELKLFFPAPKVRCLDKKVRRNTFWVPLGAFFQRRSRNFLPTFKS